LSGNSEGRPTAGRWRRGQADREGIIFGQLKPRERLVEDVLMERLAPSAMSCGRRCSSSSAWASWRASATRLRRPLLPPAEVEHIYELRELLQRHAATRIPLPARPS
jgi:hypothetical protein